VSLELVTDFLSVIVEHLGALVFQEFRQSLGLVVAVVVIVVRFMGETLFVDIELV